jgi:hypothetical protein
MKTKRKKYKKHNKTKRVFKKKDFISGDGMLTSVWGPSLWHYLHTMSFNYPINPTENDKKNYMTFILNLKSVLPCRYCRENLKNNLKKLPLTIKDMQNRHTFSKYVYDLHELINNMLGKKSGLSYCDVRERYEHFRARCTLNEINPAKEKGCVEPLYGKKSKGIIHIIPKDTPCNSIQIDKDCLKRKQ